MARDLIYRICALALGGLIALVGLPAVSEELPPSFEAVYRVNVAGLTMGEVVISLDYLDGRYVYRKFTKTRGLMSWFRNDTIEEISRGEVDGNRIRSQFYLYEYKKRGKVKRASITFPRVGKAVAERHGKTYVLKTPETTYDRASVELALMRDAGGDVLEYPVVEKGKLVNYRFKSLGEKVLDLPAGLFHCQEYEVVRSHANRSTSMCLASEAANLPVWATHNEKGTTLKMSLVRYQMKTRLARPGKTPSGDRQAEKESLARISAGSAHSNTSNAGQ